MRIRPVWIAVPACAAAGVVTYSVVAAQEPAGYYQSRNTPNPTAVADQAAQYGRPTYGKTSGGTQLPPNWLPAPSTTPPARVSVNPPPPKPRLTQPAVAGPNVPAQPVVHAGGLPPAAEQPKGRYFPDAEAPVRPAVATDIPALPPPNITPPSPTPAAPSVPTVPLPPPRVTLEPTAPVEMKPIAESPKPADPLPLPLPAIELVPATPPVVALTPAAPPAPAAVPVSSGFPGTPLPARQAPNVIVEAVAPESIGVGQTLTYELVVKNAGVSLVANVRVEDELPAGAKFLASDPAPEQGGDRLAWTLGTLEAGVERRIKVTVKPADEGELRSRAVVTFSTAAEARVRVTRPRVSVAVVASENARVGDEVPFQIKVTNSGSGPAQKLVVQAKLTDGLHHPQGGVIEAELTNLPPGETKTVTLRAMATKPGPQACTIVAAADGNSPETAKSAVHVVEPRLDAKLTGPARCLVRSEPTYTLELTNPGTASTDPVQAWAVVPDGFEFVGASDGGTFNAANRTVTWRMAGLPAGGAKAVSFKLRAAAPADGMVKVVAQAAAHDAGGIQPADYRPPAATRLLEAKADAPVKAEGVAALRFEVADVEDPVEAGKDAVYEIKVENQGTGPCTNVQVTATLADGTQVVGASGQTAGRGQGQQVVFDPIASLDAKKEAVYQVRVRGGQPGDYRFKVQVTCDQLKAGTVKEENTRFYKE